jgi:hypothetical protein
MGEGEIEGEGTSEAALDGEGAEAGETRGLRIFHLQKAGKGPPNSIRCLQWLSLLRKRKQPIHCASNYCSLIWPAWASYLRKSIQSSSMQITPLNLGWMSLEVIE